MDGDHVSLAGLGRVGARAQGEAQVELAREKAALKRALEAEMLCPLMRREGSLEKTPVLGKAEGEKGTAEEEMAR